MKGKLTPLLIIVSLVLVFVFTESAVLAQTGGSDLELYAPSELLLNEGGMLYASWNGAQEQLEWSWNLDGTWTAWEPDQNQNYASEALFSSNVVGTHTVQVRARLNFDDNQVYIANDTIEVTDEGTYLGMFTLYSDDGAYMETSVGAYSSLDPGWTYLGRFEVAPGVYKLETGFFNLSITITDNGLVLIITLISGDTGGNDSNVTWSVTPGSYIYVRNLNIAFQVDRVVVEPELNYIFLPLLRK